MVGLSFCRRCTLCSLVVLFVVVFFSSGEILRAQNDGFDGWISEIRTEVAQRGLTSPGVDLALADLQYVDRVIELDRRQPELTQTFWRYTEARVTEGRVAQGRHYLSAYAPLLAQIQARWGVPPHILVALWGLESDYGRSQGDFEVVSSVATLAFDSRRSAFFRQQLFAALELIHGGDLPPDVRGSWAGAIGQPQFIPTTIRGYAVDFDGDGRRDLCASLPDVFASAANYLQASGWDARAGWGQEVRLSGNFDYLETGLEVEKPVRDWQAMGVRQPDGSDLPASDLAASVLLPAGINGPAFLVYRNFRVILRWNNSVLYALAVGLLSDRIAGAGPLVTQRWGEEVPLSRWDVVELQSRLTTLGFEAGEPDGVVGERTRRAIRLYQRSVAIPADGYADPSLLQQLREQSGQ
jgi:membrane-bound lytic murein transglycosylase B